MQSTENIIKQQATIFSGGSSKKRDTKSDDTDEDDGKWSIEIENRKTKWLIRNELN